MLFVGNYNAQWFTNLKNASVRDNDIKQYEALTISIASISFIFMWYTYILDIIALTYSINNYSLLKTVSNDLHGIPAQVMAFDTVCMLCLCVCTIVFFSKFIHSCDCKYCCLKKNDGKCKCTCVKFLRRIDWSRHQYLLLLFIIMAAIVMLVIHVPFIAIAYLNDPYHAGSILIFYVVSFMLLLAVFEAIYFISKRLVTITKTYERTDLNIHLNSSLIRTKDTSSRDIDGFVYLSRPKLHLKVAKFAFMDSANLKLHLNKAVEGEMHNVTIMFDPADTKFQEFCNNWNSGPVILELHLTLKTHRSITINGTCDFNPDSAVLDREQGKIVFKTVQINKTKSNIIYIESACIIFCLASLLIMTLLGIVFTASYLVLIPINRSISDAPNRLIGVYQTIFLVAGIYIAYKTFFKRKISLHSVVANSTKSLSNRKDDSQWSSMSKQERLIEFYRVQAEAIQSQVEPQNQVVPVHGRQPTP